MPGKCLVTGLLAAVLFALTGCCAWCQRHCQPAVCCPSYAPAQVCCPPAPVCCPPTATPAPANVQYGPPPQQWQRTFSSPQNCSCQ